MFEIKSIRSFVDMPNASYRRKLRVIPQNPSVSYPNVVLPPIQPLPPHPPKYPCDDPFENQTLGKLYKQLNESLLVMIQDKQLENLTNASTLLKPYVKYYTILDNIDEYCATIQIHSIDPLDLETIKSETRQIRCLLTTIPHELDEPYIRISKKIYALVEFIHKTINNDTFKYSLIQTLTDIRTVIEHTTKENKYVDQIYTIIFEIIDHMKKGIPINVIYWRVNYVSELIEYLFAKLEEQ